MTSFMVEEFDTLIARCYRHGYENYGDLGIEQENFKTRLLSLVEKYLGPEPSWAAAAGFVENLYTNDLYLGAACARGTDKAWDRFTACYGKYIKDLAAFVTKTGSAAADLADDVLIDLFLPDHSGQSRIGSYEGRSSLATWLRVVVSHRAVNERERVRNHVCAAECVGDVVDESALWRVGTSLRACRYERVINDSLRRSCRALTEHERLILLLRFEEELRLGQIARLLGVHQSTVTRQIERACKKLRDEVIAALLSEHHLNKRAIDECEEDILENPSYSILPFIKHTPA